MLMAGTVLLLSAGTVAIWLACRKDRQRFQDIDWRETWRKAVEEFKAAGRRKPPTE
ncbi:MAG TPA: hypothetical protein PKM88_04980 [bacterium]|nr:hypothetical protein [bacterium]